MGVIPSGAMNRAGVRRRRDLERTSRGPIPHCVRDDAGCPASPHRLSPLTPYALFSPPPPPSSPPPPPPSPLFPPAHTLSHRHIPSQIRIPLQPRHEIRDEAVGLLAAQLLRVVDLP